MNANTPLIEIYYADVCTLCHKAMAYFRSRDLPFRAYEVFWDPATDDWVPSATVDEMRARAGNVDFVPQIFIHGARHIAGWRKLEPMIASGEFDRLLASAAEDD